jgi:hypothetical protein
MNGLIGAFISIPKNASASIRKILGPNDCILDKNHCPGSVYGTQYDLTQLFTFCFCRNPYDRVVSWYSFHLQEQHSTRNLKLPYGRFSDISAWVKAGMPHHWCPDNGAPDVNPLLQFNFVANCQLDFIARFENFVSDMQRLITVLNCRLGQNKFHYSYAHLNRSSRERKRQRLDPVACELVYQSLKQDFEFFGYSK